MMNQFKTKIGQYGNLYLYQGIANKNGQVCKWTLVKSLVNVNY